jgi:hypothetical protein
LKTQVGFGTVVGYHTVAELQDLVASYDVILRNVARRAQAVADSPKFDRVSFAETFDALTKRYNDARAAAQKAINDAKSAWRSPTMIIAEEEWNNLLSAINPRWKEYTWSPGDGSIDDLYNRLIEAGSTGTQDEPIPQPRPGTDVDLNALQTTTNITQAIEGTGERVKELFDTKHLLIYGLVGGAFVLFVLPRLMALSMGITPTMLMKR